MRRIHKLPWCSRQRVSMAALNQNLLWIVNEIQLKYFNSTLQSFRLVPGHGKYHTHLYLQNLLYIVLWLHKSYRYLYNILTKTHDVTLAVIMPGEIIDHCTLFQIYLFPFYDIERVDIKKGTEN